jgi:cytochrome c553
MKVNFLFAAMTYAVSVLGCSFSAQAQGGAVPSSQALQAKIQYCKTCHGASGQGFRGASPMPRLAGQQPEYFLNQVRAFAERRRDNKLMYGVSHVLDTAMQTAIADHFKQLNTKPLGGAPRELVSSGKKLYDEGVPSVNIPPCGSCHGPDAKGNGVFPRLAGQLHDYTLSKLVNWTNERGRDPAKPDSSAIMEPIAHGLTRPQAAALAAYLSYLD